MIFKPEILRPYTMLREKRGLSREWKLVARHQIAFYLINFYGFVKISLKYFAILQLEANQVVFYISGKLFKLFMFWVLHQSFMRDISCMQTSFTFWEKSNSIRNALEFCLAGFWWQFLQFDNKNVFLFCHITILYCKHLISFILISSKETSFSFYLLFCQKFQYWNMFILRKLRYLRAHQIVFENDF